MLTIVFRFDSQGHEAITGHTAAHQSSAIDNDVRTFQRDESVGEIARICFF